MSMESIKLSMQRNYFFLILNNSVSSIFKTKKGIMKPVILQKSRSVQVRSLDKELHPAWYS